MKKFNKLYFGHLKKIIFIIYIIILSNNTFGVDYSNNFIDYTSSSKKILLNKGWTVNLDKADILDNISIPYFIKDNNIDNIVFNKVFSFSEDEDFSKARLWIMGIHGYVQIYFNNKLIKDHINLSSSYYIDIDSKLLKDSTNTLKILIKKYDDSGNSLDLRFPNYPKQFRPLGIAREIYLEIFPKKYLDDIIFKYSNNNLILDYSLIITDSSKSRRDNKIKLEEEVIAPDGITIYKRFQYFDNKKSLKSIDRKISIKYPLKWNAINPYLYNVKLTITSASKSYFNYNRKIGLREINSKSKKIYINNSLINIKGINYRFNFKNNSNYEEKTKIDLNIIKEIGFNSARFINYIPSLSIAQYADSIGLYLFIDNGIWRMPAKNYSRNNNFDYIKSAINEMAESFSLHPSVIGIGVGNEPFIDSPTVKKFTIVLNKYLKDNFNFLSYISPINFDNDSYSEIADMMIFQNYLNPNKLFSKYQKFSSLNIPLILGNINFPINNYNSLNNNKITEINKLKQFFYHYDSLNVFSGYFVESFNDWVAETPNIYTKLTDNNELIYPFGLVNSEGTKSEKFYYFSDRLKNNTFEVSYYKNNQFSNFNSIIVFIISIIFFLVYKRSYRLRENLIRSLQHPYGFFVDLRDRRIISVFNSTLMGLTVGIIISSFLSSIIYANYDSILFDEFINIVIKDNNLKRLSLSIISSPWKLFSIILLCISLMQILFVLLIKFITILSKEKRKFRQIYSVISWSGAPLLLFIPISIFAYTFIVRNILYPEILWLFLLFLVWFNFRIANGFRVLYLIQPFKMIIVVFLTYLILIITFLVYINMDINIIDSIKMLNTAQNLY